MTNTILIINEHAAESRFLVEVLEPQGYTVHVLPVTKITQETFTEFLPDLMIWDIQFAEAYGHLKAQIQDAIPVIFSGAIDTDLDRGEVFARGGVDYLAKPFRAEEVLARVETHLALRRLRQQATAQEAALNEAIAARQKMEAELHHANDVLEQRVIESTATLRASEAMFRYLLARADDGYIIVDEQEQVLYANAKAQIYLGLGHEIDKTAPPKFMDLVKQRYRCEPQAAWALWPKKMFISKVPVPLYLVCPETLQAKAFWLQVEMLDIAAGLDMQAGRIICLKDITEKTALQEELNRFHSVIAHKLRTPLVPLYSGLGFLAEQVKTMSRDDIMMFVQNAAEGAEHLYTEIEDIVRYLGAPLIAGPTEAFPLANFPALITNISGELLLQDVTVKVDKSLQDQRLALSRWNLEVILWEILENAKKFHPRNMPTITVDVAPTGVQQTRIQVWDNGLTLSPEQLIRMWMPYYQIDKYTTGQISGMGLGLSTVATQVWSVGGTCRSFNREDGPGIVVELVLPNQA
ncbi:MAG TPA: ATP-binding protein [Anaerolineae bacterium]|nr:ATP-binding protein [Anaerolineae bacterium]HQK15426.1 ATP-binding protein [Anaerolineae bacterium]